MYQGTVNNPTELARTDKKCTIYYRESGISVGNIKKLVVKRAVVECGQYAQYDSALTVRFRAPRKRSDAHITQTFRPNLLIVDGDGPEPDAIWDESKDERFDGLTIRHGRYRSTDSRWQGDFNKMIDARIADGSVKVIFDGRGHDSGER